MSFFRKKQGFSLVELMLSLAVGLIIVMGGLVVAVKNLNEAQAKNNGQTTLIILNNIKNYLSTSKADGSDKSNNPINNQIAISNEFISAPYRNNGSWIDIRNFGQVQFEYATDYSSANVVSMKIKGIDSYTCSYFVSHIADQVLEMKLGSSYLAYNKTVSNGNTTYNVNISKSIPLCNQLIKNRDTMTINYFASPDISSIYSSANDISGTPDPNNVANNTQIQSIQKALTYAYNIKNSHS